MLLDTRLDNTLEKKLTEEWEGSCHFSSYTSNARGIAMLINKNLNHKVLDTRKDDNGNHLAVNLETQNKKIAINCIYGPNRDQPTFYKQLF